MATIFILFLLFVFKLGQIALFHRDAQYYIQASILWPKGLVSFAGSWIGGRDLVVFFYHSLMAIFGENTDALSLGLALIYCLTCIFLTFSAFLIANSPVIAAAASILTAIIIFAFPIWSYPATDNLAAMALSGLWLCYIAACQSSNKWLVFLVLPLSIAVASHIRTELLLFGLIALASFSFQGKSSYIKKSAICLTLIIFTQFSAMIVDKSWNLWVPTNKPYTYKGVFLFQLPFTEFAAGENGASSTILANSMRLSAKEIIPFWETLGTTYSKFGAAESDKLMTLAALEALHHHSWEFIKKRIEFLGQELNNSYNLSILGISKEPWQSRQTAQRDTLLELDKVRIDNQMKFGQDFIYPTAKLTDNGLIWLQNLRKILPPIVIQIVIPFYLYILFAFFIMPLLFFVNKSHRKIIFPVLLYAVGLQLLAGFSQGYLTRYLDGVLLLQFLECCIAVMSLFTYFFHKDVSAKVHNSAASPSVLTIT